MVVRDSQFIIFERQDSLIVIAHGDIDSDQRVKHLIKNRTVQKYIFKQPKIEFDKKLED